MLADNCGKACLTLAVKGVLIQFGFIYLLAPWL
jgi:hypothetical protein